MNASAADPIDTRQIDFLSFGPPLGALRRPGMEELRVSVEPERDMHRHESVLIRPNFPLRKGKVQRPLLPEDTLRRDRLLDWMTSKAHCRLIYIVAEAGFGKTTLAADFTRRSRVRTFWYRLDEDDTDGLVMLRYIVASARNVDPELFRATDSLLTEPSLEPVSFDSVFPTFMYEFERLGDVPSVIVLDDYYMAEHVASIRSTLEKLIERAPANLTFIFATRRTPDLSVASFRARGDLAELGREDLRLVLDETRRLFEVHNQPLEPDVLESIQARTDGWAASLQLVKTAVEGRTRSQVRAFVDSLSGAEGHLYDYLAEEVVGDLAPDLRGFLLRVSLLEDIETETAASVTALSEPTVRRLIAEAQRIGLLSRAESSAGWRPHPLVREFLLAHLEQEVGREGVLQLHRDIAATFEPISWRLSARHWAAAAESDEVRRVLTAAVPSIIASGDLDVAEELADTYLDASNPWYGLLKVHSLLAQGRPGGASELLVGLRARVDRGDLDSSFSATVALMELGLSIAQVDPQGVSRAADELLRIGDEELASIAKAASAAWSTSEQDDISAAADKLREAAAQSHRANHRRFEGVSQLNLAFILRVLGLPQQSLQAARTAIGCLSSGGSNADLLGARTNAALALADLGRWPEACQEIETILATDGPIPRDVFLELALVCAQYDLPERAEQLHSARLRSSWESEPPQTARVVTAWIRLAAGDAASAREVLANEIGGQEPIAVGINEPTLRLQLDALLEPGDPYLPGRVSAAIEVAAHQSAWFSWFTLRIIQACLSTPGQLTALVADLGRDRPNQLSIAGALIVRRLDWLGENALRLVKDEAQLRPNRWRPLVRQLLDQRMGTIECRRRATSLLVEIGTTDDFRRAAALSTERRLGITSASRMLRRRLAPLAYVEDLGRVRIRLGDTVLSGSEVRRKVLSLLTYLLTRPQFAATREQIQEALWPELDPQAATNSLNQTAYFLRRVLEPTCRENDTAGYLDNKGELVWLDKELIRSRSRECQSLLDVLRKDPQPALAAQLAATYTARFATDFLYDDWSCAYRDNLHAAFLSQMERCIKDDLRIGALERGIALAQQALMADPEAEEIELLLLRLYLAAGAHGAAAEQYAHYAMVMREQLGLEPPPLEGI